MRKLYDIIYLIFEAEIASFKEVFYQYINLLNISFWFKPWACFGPINILGGLKMKKEKYLPGMR